MKPMRVTSRLWRVFTLPPTTTDTGEALSTAHAQEKLENCQCLLKILSNLRFLTRQSCAIRGDADESDSNFMQLFKLQAEDDPIVYEWLKKCTNKYTRHEIQNELLKIMYLGKYLLAFIVRRFTALWQMKQLTYPTENR